MAFIMKELSRLLDKEIYKFNIGEILNVEFIDSGRTTVVIDLNIEDMFLVLSNDNHKREVYDSLKIKTTDFTISDNEFVNKLEEELNLFYVEKLDSCEKLNLDTLERAIEILENSILSDFGKLYGIKLNSSKFKKSRKDILDIITKEYSDFNLNEDPLLFDYVKRTYDSMFKISRKISGTKVNLDLFEKQFLCKNGKLICIDPFLIVSK